MCAFSCKGETILFPFEENEDDSKSALRYILKHIHREEDEIIFYTSFQSYRRAYHDTMVVGLKPESEIEMAKSIKLCGTGIYSDFEG